MWSQSRAWCCKGTQRQPGLRHVLGATGSGVSQPCVCHLCPALRHGCASQRLMANSPCSCWNSAAVLARFVCPHIAICSCRVCDRSRDCSVHVETQNASPASAVCVWASAEHRSPLVSSQAQPSCYYTQKIRFYPCSTWNISWIWKGKPKKCIREKVAFSLNGVSKWRTKRFGVAKMILHCTWVIFLNVLPFQVCVLRLWSRGTVGLGSKKKKSKFASRINIYSFIDLKWNFTWEYKWWPQWQIEGTLVPVLWRYLSSARNTSKILAESFCCGALTFLSCSSSRVDLIILTLKRGWVWKVFLEWMVILFVCNTDQCTLNCTCASGNWSEETVVQVPEFCKILAKELALIII